MSISKWFEDQLDVDYLILKIMRFENYPDNPFLVLELLNPVATFKGNFEKLIPVTTVEQVKMALHRRDYCLYLEVLDSLYLIRGTAGLPEEAFCMVLNSLPDDVGIYISNSWERLMAQVKDCKDNLPNHDVLKAMFASVGGWIECSGSGAGYPTNIATLARFLVAREQGKLSSELHATMQLGSLTHPFVTEIGLNQKELEERLYVIYGLLTARYGECAIELSVENF